LLTVLKLGGSVLTKKDTPETVDDEAMEHACDTIADVLTASQTDTDPGQLLIVHGGGSFGHHHAKAHGLSSSRGTRDGEALTAVHRAMGELNTRLVDELHERDVNALPVRPLSVAYRNDATLHFDAGAVQTMLDEGFVPVTHGDVVTERGSGGTILSGDDIVVSLTATLSPERVGLCSTVPGVMDDNGEVIERIDSYAEVESILGESDTTDVTGGMAHKVSTLLEMDVPASIFSGESLSEFLNEGRAGTVVH
jgi:isopentenyl phosphate kinase